MNDEIIKYGLYIMSEDDLIKTIRDHLIEWSREEAQANNRNFRDCYDNTRDSFMAELETKV